jgi:hypothetical protein
MDVTKTNMDKMPYLHWETDKHRRRMAEVMKEVTENHRKNMVKEFPHLKEEREDVAKIVEKVRIKYGSRVPSDEVLKKAHSDKIHKRSPLGQYLLDIANVYDAMDIEPDVRLLTEHLHPHESQNPPLHGRRTLDQSYYWKLENTAKRDEDQVVYRGTKAGNSIYRTTRVIMVDQLWLYVLDDSKRSNLSLIPILGHNFVSHWTANLAIVNLANIAVFQIP